MEHARLHLGGKIVLITAAFKAHAALNFWRGQELRGNAAEADTMGQFGKLSVARRPAAGQGARHADLQGRGARQSRARTAQDQACAQAAARDSSRIRGRAGQVPKAKAALEASRRARSAIISSGSRRRSRRRPGEAHRHRVEWLSEGKRRHWKYQDC